MIVLVPLVLGVWGVGLRAVGGAPVDAGGGRVGSRLALREVNLFKILREVFYEIRQSSSVKEGGDLHQKRCVWSGDGRWEW